MHQSKLLELLRAIPGRQLARFRDFMDSPYFNRSAELLAFYDYIAVHAPEFRHEALEKSALIARFNPGNPVTLKRLSYLMNQLLGLAEEFVAVEQFRQHAFELPLTLLNALNPALLPRQFKTAQEKAGAALEAMPFRNWAYYLEKFRLQTLLHARSEGYQRQINPALQASSDALDEFYLVEKLRYCWAMTNFESVLNIRYDWNLGNWLLNYVEQARPVLNPTAMVYYTGIALVKYPDNPEHFHRHKALVREHEALFPEDERKFLYTGLLNYCTRRINRFNDTAFLAEYLEINQALLAAGMLFEDGQLSPWRFLNLVNVGLLSGQSSWVRDFIRDYSAKLPAEYTEDCRLTALGEYHYHLKEYGPAQKLLNQANHRDVLLSVTIRNLLTRIYYETGETELLLSFLEAYRVYLLRQELLNPQMKNQARQFVDFTRRLAKIDGPELHLLPKLLDELPPASEIYHRDWLVRQIELKRKGPGG